LLFIAAFHAGDGVETVELFCKTNVQPPPSLVISQYTCKGAPAGLIQYTPSPVESQIVLEGIINIETKEKPQITSGFKQISTGQASTCALSYDNKAYCWGSSIYGTPELGNALIDKSNKPVQIYMGGVLDGKTIKLISAGYSEGCAIASDDMVYCWGNNFNGKLGNNSTINSATPIAVDTSGVLKDKTILLISSGYYHVCAIASDNYAYCWGNNGFSNHNDLTPVAVDMTGVLKDKTILSISASNDHTTAIASDNQAYYWSHSRYGQLNDTLATKAMIPVAVDSNGLLKNKTVLAIDSGDVSSCLIASDYQVYCWGYNNFGELGNNSTNNSLSAVAVDTSGVLKAKKITSIAVGGFHACALASDGTVYCWGKNNHGQLGDGSKNDSLVPVAVDVSGVLTGKELISITAYSNHTCALSSDGDAYCWGENDDGELGNNSNEDSNIPVAVDQ